MPLTRKQAAKIEKMVVIPARNDISLVQKRGNCIEGLPTALFQIIQDHLSKYDYCQLMNTNLSTFQPIKYETVHYTILINKSDLCDAYNETVALQMVAGVKDKCKQIAVRLSDVDEKLVRKYSKFYDGVASVHLKRFSFGSNMNFQMFYSLTELKLTEIKITSEIDINLENLALLVIYQCSFRGVSSWNKNNKLKAVEIRDCQFLEFLPPLNNLDRVVIKSCFQLHELQTTGGHKAFTFIGCEVSISLFQQMIQPSFYAKMKRLKLSCRFPDQVHDFSVWQNIPVVELNAAHAVRHTFPVFYGVELRLVNFKLPAWNECNELPNLKVCDLRCCQDFRTFPCSPKLKSLTLEKCPGLRLIPSQPNLRKLEVKSCELVEKIEFGNHLNFAVIYHCEALKDLAFCSSLEYLNVSLCGKLKTVKPLKPLPSSEELNERKVDLTQTNLYTKCCLYLGRYQTSMSDFSFCQNLYEVEVVSIELLVNLEGFHNISCLQITNCHCLVTTEGIGKILKRLILKNCFALTRLIGLQGIPIVLINDCLKIDDFTGLGNHDLLIVFKNDRFDELVEEYRTMNKHAKIFSDTKEIASSNGKKIKQ
jgi:hypothetical protein